MTPIRQRYNAVLAGREVAACNVDWAPQLLRQRCGLTARNECCQATQVRAQRGRGNARCWKSAVQRLLIVHTHRMEDFITQGGEPACYTKDGHVLPELFQCS